MSNNTYEGCQWRTCCKQQRIDRSSFIFFKSLHSCRYIKVYLNGKSQKGLAATQLMHPSHSNITARFQILAWVNYSAQLVPPFLWSSTTEHVEIKRDSPMTWHGPCHKNGEFPTLAQDHQWRSIMVHYFFMGIFLFGHWFCLKLWKCQKFGHVKL